MSFVDIYIRIDITVISVECLVDFC